MTEAIGATQATLQLNYKMVDSPAEAIFSSSSSGCFHRPEDEIGILRQVFRSFDHDRIRCEALSGRHISELTTPLL